MDRESEHSSEEFANWHPETEESGKEDAIVDKLDALFKKIAESKGKTPLSREAVWKIWREIKEQEDDLSHLRKTFKLYGIEKSEDELLQILAQRDVAESKGEFNEDSS